MTFRRLLNILKIAVLSLWPAYMLTKSWEQSLLFSLLLFLLLAATLFRREITHWVNGRISAYRYARSIYTKIDHMEAMAEQASLSCRENARDLTRKIDRLRRKRERIGKDITQQTEAYISKVILKLTIRRDLYLARARELMTRTSTLRRRRAEMELQEEAHRYDEESRLEGEGPMNITDLLNDLKDFVDYDLEERLRHSPEDDYEYDEFLDLKFATEDLRRMARQQDANALLQATAGANGTPAHEDKDDLLYEQIEFNLKKLEVLERW